MRVSRWDGKKVFQEVQNQVWENGRLVMDRVVLDAKRRCKPIGTVTRSGRFQNATVTFIPKTGKNKDTLVSFGAKRWAGRSPGSLCDSIRRVERAGSGNIRVYAGNFKVYYAMYVERGTRRPNGTVVPPRPFLRPSLQKARRDYLKVLKEGR